MIVHRNMEISLIYKGKNVGRSLVWKISWEHARRNSSRPPISPYFAAVCWDMANIGQPIPNNSGCMKQETIKKQSRNNQETIKKQSPTGASLSR